MGGGTLGYNWQVSRFLVVGFEGDGSWGSEYGSGPDIGTVGNPAFLSFTKETWLATARLRVGYAVNNLLFYGTGGYAAAGVEAGVKDANTLRCSSLRRHRPTAAGRPAAASNGDLRRTGRPSSNCSTCNSIAWRSTRFRARVPARFRSTTRRSGLASTTASAVQARWSQNTDRANDRIKAPAKPELFYAGADRLRKSSGHGTGAFLVKPAQRGSVRASSYRRVL